jgi:hypothetical protein
MGSETRRASAGHLRPQGEKVWGGVVHGLHGSAGDTVPAAEFDAARDAASAAAVALGWEHPLRWDGPDDDGCYALSGMEPPPLGGWPP